jgi:hypothetical protein
MELAIIRKKRLGLPLSIQSEKINFFLGLLAILSMGLIPINIFPIGGFQIADVFITILIAYYILKKSELENKVKTHIYLLLPFIIWTNIVLGGYLLIYVNFRLLITAINMLYAFLMLFAFSKIWNELLSKKAYQYIYSALILSVICVFTFKGLISWEDMRYSFSFNNPNQLGLFALIFLAITIVLMQQKKADNIANIIYFSLDIFFILLAHYWAFMALSRATFAAFLLLDICLLKNMHSQKLFLPVASAIFVGGILMLFINPTFIQQRIEARGTHRFGESALEERIKIGITEPMKDLKGIKLLFGTGQIPVLQVNDPGDTRFRNDKNKIEVHNMFGNVLWSYGIIGLSLYVFWIAKIIWEVRVIPNALYIWGALLTFSVSGVLFRSRSYWLVLGLMMALLNIEMTKDKKKSQELDNHSKHGKVP